MPRSPMSQETRARAAALHAEGVSRNEIARRIDVDPATVTRWAQAEGLSFDRSKTEAATAAHSFDLRAARLRLAEKMTANAERSLAAVDEGYLVYSFGGKDNRYNEHRLAEAPLSARREAQTIAAIAFDKLTRAEESTSGAVEGVVSLIGVLAGRLGISDP